MMHVPAPVIVTVVLRTVQAPEAAKLTASPDDAVAVTANGASPKVLFAKLPNEMV
jgi:hypothetical protein